MRFTRFLLSTLLAAVQPQEIGYSATVSMDVTLSPPAILGLIGQAELAKVTAAVTAHISPPDDVDITSVNLHETTPGVVRLIAITMNASSAAIIAQGFSNQTIEGITPIARSLVPEAFAVFANIVSIETISKPLIVINYPPSAPAPPNNPPAPPDTPPAPPDTPPAPPTPPPLSPSPLPPPPPPPSPSAPPLQPGATTEIVPGKKVTLVLKAGGAVEEYEAKADAVTASLRRELQCYLPACVLTVTVEAGSVILTVVATHASAGGTSPVESAAVALQTKPLDAMSNALGVTIEEPPAAPLVIDVQVQVVRLAPSPPPPSPPPPSPLPPASPSPLPPASPSPPSSQDAGPGLTIGLSLGAGCLLVAVLAVATCISYRKRRMQQQPSPSASTRAAAPQQIDVIVTQPEHEEKKAPL